MSMLDVIQDLLERFDFFRSFILVLKDRESILKK